MTIYNVINLIIELCIHYYKSYYLITENITIDISNKSIDKLKNNIINNYLLFNNDEHVYDIAILVHDISSMIQYKVDKYGIDNDIVMDFEEAKTFITKYIKRGVCFSTNEPIISISPHPIENYFDITDSMIRWTLDIYQPIK